MLAILDTETGDKDLTSSVAVLTHTPSAADPMVCKGEVVLGDGVKNLTGVGGDFELTVTVGGVAIQPDPQTITFSAQARGRVFTSDFPVPASAEVVLKVKSPNAGDSDVGVTATLYDASSANVLSVSDDKTAADNLEAQFDGTGLTGDKFPATQAQINALPTASTINVTNDTTYNTVGYQLVAGTLISGTAEDTKTIGTPLVFAPGDSGLDVNFRFSFGTGKPSSVSFQGYYYGEVGIPASRYADVYAWNYVTSAWVMISTAATRVADGSADVGHIWPLTLDFKDPVTGYGMARYVSPRTTVSDRLYIDYHSIVVVNTGLTADEIAVGVWAHNISSERFNDHHDSAGYFLSRTITAITDVEVVNGATIQVDETATLFTDHPGIYTGRLVQFHEENTTNYEVIRIVTDNGGGEWVMEHAPLLVVGGGLWDAYVLTDMPSDALRSNQVTILDDLTSTEGKVDTISSVVTTTDGKVDDLTLAVSTVDGKVDIITAGVATIDGKVDAVSLAVGVVDGKIDGVTSAVGIVDGKVDGVTSAVGVVDGKVDALSVAVGGVSTAVGTVDGKVDALTVDVSDVAIEVSTIDGKVDILTSNVGDVSTAVGTVDGKVDTLTLDVAGVAASVGVVDGKVDGVAFAVIAVDGKVDTVTVNVAAVDGKVDLLAAATGIIDGKVDALTADVAAVAIVVNTVDGKTDTLTVSLADLAAVAAVIQDLNEADVRVDLMKSPLELVVSQKGTSIELMRKVLYQHDQVSGVTSALQHVGKTVDTAVEV